MSVLSKPYFHDEKAAFEKLEAIVWPDGPTCPHCGEAQRIYVLEGVQDKKGRVRHGLKKCGSCRKQFTVRVGTVFESSHVPLHKWLQATHLLCSSKKGISAHQLHRILEVTYKTAWFMAHRLREAMRDTSPLPLGGEGKVVEADETFIGRIEGMPKRHPSGKRGGGASAYMNTVVTLVERGGSARSFHVDSHTFRQIVPIVRANIRREARLMTDKARHYVTVGQEFAQHGSVDHGRDEYVRGDIHTNTVEGFYSIFKRGMKGVYQHCKEKHLHRYLAEFDFRYSERKLTDRERAETALRGIQGKRLTYGGPSSGAP